MSGAPLCSIVVCTMASRREDLRRCLESLAPLGGEFEVLVVAWAGETAEPPASPGVRLVTSRSRCAAGKKNDGVRAASGRFVAFIDDDARAFPDYGARLLEAFGTGVDFLAGVVEPRFDAEMPEALRSVAFAVGGFNRLGAEERAEAWLSANCAFRRDFLRALGPFDLRLGPGGSYLPWGEDSDMFRRARARGRGVFARDVRVAHRIQAERIGLRYVLHRVWLAGRTQALLDRRHGRNFLRSALPVPLYALRTGLAARLGGGLPERIRARRFAGYAWEALRQLLVGIPAA